MSTTVVSGPYCPRHGNAMNTPHQAIYDGSGNILPPPMAFALGPAWQSHVCDCGEDTNSCVEGVCCPWCQLGFMYHRTRRSYVDMDATVCVAACCGDFFSFGLGYVIMVAFMRHKVVHRYRLRDSAMAAVCESVFCAPCTLCRLHREMTTRGECPGGVCIESRGITPSQAPAADAGMGAVGPHAGGGGMWSPRANDVEGKGAPTSKNPYYTGVATDDTQQQQQSQQNHGYGDSVGGGGSDAMYYGGQGSYYSPTGVYAPRSAAAPPHAHKVAGGARRRSFDAATPTKTPAEGRSPQLAEGTPVYPDTPASAAGFESSPASPGPRSSGSRGHSSA